MEKRVEIIRSESPEQLEIEINYFLATKEGKLHSVEMFHFNEDICAALMYTPDYEDKRTPTC